jgi:VCBS repeat protein
MTTTPKLWKSQTQVNSSDAPFPGRGGSSFQGDGQIAALHDGGYVVVWEDDSRTHNPDGAAIVGQRYDAAGNKAGGEVNISQFTGGHEFSPAVTVLPNGNIAVAFVDKFNGDQDIYVRIFDSALNFVRQDTIDNAETKQTFDPSLTAFVDGSYVVSYTLGSGDDTDIVARHVSADGVMGAQFDIDNQTDNRHASQLATLSNGNFVAVYQDEVAGNSTNTEIVLKVFTPTGTPVPGAVGIVRGADGPGQEIEPDVAALRGGGFVVVWSDPDGASPNDIRASILSNATQVVASNILVNTTTAGYQLAPSVLALADGGFLVTWTDQHVNLARAQRFDANGSKIGAEFTLNTGDADPQAALLNDGRIAFSVGDLSTGDRDVMTSIFTVDTPFDFNANGLSDILWQGSDGTPALWLMNGTSAVSVGAAGSFNPGPSWHVKDSGDFNGDDHADILWQSDNGTPAIWLMNGSNTTFVGAVGPFNPGPSWQIKDTGDFNGDGKSDVL